ncbi:MAG TPA: orotidine-5'-phosphate decarboxylase [Polyangiaceae bacterium]|nr:orotidine-5'-phosphate decarboxylase [Polyangiaceae bacterium]
MAIDARERLVFALDYPSLEAATRGANAVRGHVGLVKVGLELFVQEGPAALALGDAAAARIFLDLKLHDIPATVGRSVASVSRLVDDGVPVDLLTVHASGGRAMLEQAVEHARGFDVVAVTVLTSLDARDLKAMGVDGPVGEQVARLAEGAWAAGVRAFVCSPVEAALLREALGPEAELITPGVRPAGAATQDQKRICTPADAIGRGADRLVVGRPIRDASDPARAADAIVAEIAEAAAS